MSIKQLIRRWFYPEVQWRGRYETWAQASRKCTSYNNKDILEKVLASSRLVRDGLKSYERDSVSFDEPSYHHVLINAFFMAQRQSDTPLQVVDFGGALGSTFFQHRHILKALKISVARWHVVEQEALAGIGNKEFKDQTLMFTPNTDSIVVRTTDILILSSVLTYMEKPYEVFSKLLGLQPRYVFVDRTGFTLNETDHLTLQTVRPPIYRASYPCWFLSKSKLLQIAKESGYDLVFEFPALDRANIPSVYLGFLFVRR